MSTIQDFNVLEKLGEGSFSSVYKVQRKSDGQYYAMKKVTISLQSFKERENALNEVRILASLDSPYIVEYKDSFLTEDSNILYVIMEFATGGDLNNVLNKSKPKGLEEAEIWRALTQISLGVKTLHENGILHRDLKLANVFCTKTPEGNHYKIGDLNISKVTHGANAKTQAGTPYYASPEVWKGVTYSWPCDIWSIGCIIYELATQVPPFRAADLQSLSRRIQAGHYDAVPAKYSKALSEVIAMLLQVNPSKRPSCEQILKNPLVIKNSGAILVEGEENGKKVGKLLQTIKLPFNLKQLKGNLPKANYENKVRRSNSSAGLRIQTSETPQLQKSKKPDEPLKQPTQLQQVQKQGLPPTPSQQLNKPPLLRPPVSTPTQNNKAQQPLSQRVQQQEQRLLGQYQQNQHQPPRPTQQQQQITPRAQSPRGNQRVPAGLPSQMGKRQYSAGPLYRR